MKVIRVHHLLQFEQNVVAPIPSQAMCDLQLAGCDPPIRFHCEPWSPGADTVDRCQSPRPIHKGRHYPAEVILLCVRWYLRYPLAYEHVAEMMAERGLGLDPSCIWRWVQVYGPEINERCRPHLKPTNKSYRVDETYIKVKGQDRYLYRAVDSAGQTIDFLLTAKRDAAGAKRFLSKALSAVGNPHPRVINVDKNPAYPAAVDLMKAEGTLRRHVHLRQ